MLARVVVTLCPEVFHRNVPAFEITGLAQALAWPRCPEFFEGTQARPTYSAEPTLNVRRDGSVASVAATAFLTFFGEQIIFPTTHAEENLAE